MQKRNYKIPTGRLVYNNTHGKRITQKHIDLVQDWLDDKILLETLARKTSTRRIPAKDGKPGKNSVATVYILVARTLKTMYKDGFIS